MLAEEPSTDHVNQYIIFILFFTLLTDTLGLMDQPLLSIIIPVYNSVDSITTIVTAIRNETFSDFELLLIDDGSTDTSLAIISNLAKQDSRIKIYSKENGGPSSARNLGLAHARGKYIQFYDADDTIVPQALSTIVAAISRNNSDLLISGWQITDISRQKILQISPKEVTVNHEIVSFVLTSLGEDGTLYNLWNKLFRGDIIRKHAIRFRDDVFFGEDLLFTLDYFEHTKRLYIIPAITYNYHSGSGSSLFRASSIVPSYRRINDEGLRKFTGTTKDKKTNDLMQWVRWRWLLSYWMLVAQSKKSMRDKIQLISQGVDSDLTIASQRRHIGTAYYTLEVAMSYIKHSPYSALVFGYILALIKKLFRSLVSRSML